MSTPLDLIRRAALSLLARREHSVLELTRKLRAKGFNAADIQAVLQTLVQENGLNESRFIESYIYSRRQKGYGPLRILQELNARGIAEDMIEHHLNIADNAWFAEAYRVWEKRFKGLVSRDMKTRAKQMRFMQYRGFTSEQIDYVMCR